MPFTELKDCWNFPLDSILTKFRNHMEETAALMIMDSFKRQVTDAFMNLLNAHSIHVCNRSRAGIFPKTIVIKLNHVSCESQYSGQIFDTCVCIDFNLWPLSFFCFTQNTTSESELQKINLVWSKQGQIQDILKGGQDNVVVQWQASLSLSFTFTVSNPSWKGVIWPPWPPPLDPPLLSTVPSVA